MLAHRLTAIVAFATLVPAVAQGQVPYSNYGPGDSYSQTSTSTALAGYSNSASRFVPSVSGGCTLVEPAACAGSTCAGDFNRAGGVTLQDLFDYLTAWFAGRP